MQSPSSNWPKNKAIYIYQRWKCEEIQTKNGWKNPKQEERQDDMAAWPVSCDTSITMEMTQNNKLQIARQFLCHFFLVKNKNNIANMLTLNCPLVWIWVCGWLSLCGKDKQSSNPESINHVCKMDERMVICIILEVFGEIIT